MDPTTSRHGWRGCLLGTAGGLIVMALLVGFYTFLYLNHADSTQARVARPTEASAEVATKGPSPTASFELPADGLWTAECRQRPCAGCVGQWTWTLAINLGTRSFESHAVYDLSSVDSGGWLHTTHLVHEGVGEIAEDGMLHGPFHETTTLTSSKGGVVGDPQVIEYDNNLYGVFSTDLKSICISRGEDPGNYDVDYIRRIGRKAFFAPDMGCEAECTTSRSP